ncbi:MAG: oxidoreductase [Campylobacteraceae bacterium]|nr:oxidoreductase [Campylobacteraceae bacterium]MBT4030141.1 oxidoreductase [Campylobacteraceae bacterium]MBT4179016.1 oxidoreductase [Campylobacteraceae bacterium]MBT4572397.1 oxidoreductase [Campylobacteraceae bacterium]MBT4708543.1 oxidoreductase [Campylobacteraceae bacterium]
MKNLWNDNDAKSYKSDLALRVYTSNLLGQSDELVLHGGGNTSVKSTIDGEDILYVKGSGWDLVSIKEEGFPAVKLDTLLDMSQLETLSDIDMVNGQKEAMIDKSSPNPSVEAILHALIPYKFVDHTHADAVVTISNSNSGIENISKIYPNFLIVPYVMPGFILAQTIHNMTKDNFDWKKCEGIILHNHGIFTFDNDSKNSYSKMIDAVSLAENFLNTNANIEIKNINFRDFDTSVFTSEFMNINNSKLAQLYSSQDNLKEFASRGVLTPEHVIRTKRIPLIIEDENIETALEEYKEEYIAYFNKFSNDEICLNQYPKYAIIKNFGIVSFGKTQKEADIINDIISHTMLAVLKADKLGGYKSISIKDTFNMEYWELEQIKLKTKK